MKFKSFINENFKDIYGFGRKTDKKTPHTNENPINAVNFDLFYDLIKQKTINDQQGKLLFSGGVQWGDGVGAIKVTVDPSYRIATYRQIKDKLGNPRWILKRFYQVDKRGYGGFEDVFAVSITDEVEKISKEPLDNTVEDKDLDIRVRKILNKIRKVQPENFMFREVRKLSPVEYIISFEIAGQGIELPIKKKIEQNQTYISFDTDCGLLKVFNQNVISPSGKRRSWDLDQSNFDALFVNSQNDEDIASMIATHIKYSYEYS